MTENGRILKDVFPFSINYAQKTLDAMIGFALEVPKAKSNFIAFPNIISKFNSNMRCYLSMSRACINFSIFIAFIN